MNKSVLEALKYQHEENISGSEDGELIVIDLDQDVLYKCLLWAEFEETTFNDFVSNLLEAYIEQMSMEE